jgi:hypothetical protein
LAVSFKVSGTVGYPLFGGYNEKGTYSLLPFYGWIFNQSVLEIKMLLPIGIPEMIMICGILLAVGLISLVMVRMGTGRPNRSKSGKPMDLTVDKSATGRLKELNRLLENHLITDEEYEAKKAEILKQI